MEQTAPASLDVTLLLYAVLAAVAVVVVYAFLRPRRAEDANPAPAPSLPGPSSEVLALPGMSQASAEALAGAGITTLDHLRALEGDAVIAAAKHARLEDFALRRWVGLAALLSVPGMDTDLAQALVRIGVGHRRGLAGENRDRVQNKLKALHDAEGTPLKVPSAAKVDDLIAAAAD